MEDEIGTPETTRKVPEAPGDKPDRKPYKAPELVRWGSLVDLTLGRRPCGSQDAD